MNLKFQIQEQLIFSDVVRSYKAQAERLSASADESFLREFNHCRLCFQLQTTFSLLKLNVFVLNYENMFQILKLVIYKTVSFTVYISIRLNFPSELKAKQKKQLW